MDEEPSYLGQIKLKDNSLASVYHLQTGDRHTLYIPTYDDYPDASRRSVIEGEFDHNTFTIHSLNTGSNSENYGLARGLLGVIAKGLGANKIIALSPSTESEDKGIYQKLGFKTIGRNRVWQRQ